MRFRSTTVTATSTTVSLTGCDLNSYHIVNRHSAAIFVKLYNSTVATFQDEPVDVIQVGATASVTVGNKETFLHGFPKGLCVRVVTGSADGDNAPPATLPIIQLEYK